jgi:hypothetical protein
MSGCGRPRVAGVPPRDTDASRIGDSFGDKGAVRRATLGPPVFAWIL